MIKIIILKLKLLYWKGKQIFSFARWLSFDLTLKKMNLDCKGFEPRKVEKVKEGDYCYYYFLLSDFEDMPNDIKNAPLELFPKKLWFDDRGVATGGTGKITKHELSCATIQVFCLEAFEGVKGNMSFEAFSASIKDLMKKAIQERIDYNLKKMNDFLVDGN